MASFANWMKAEQERKNRLFSKPEVVEASDPVVVNAQAIPLEEEVVPIGTDLAATFPLEDDPEADVMDLDAESAIDRLERELMSTEETSPRFTEFALPVIKSWESFVPEAYFATDDERERGIATVGYGQTEGVKEGDTVTEEEAEQYLTSQLERTGQRLEEEIGSQWETLTPAQQAAVTSLAYNVDKDVVGQFKDSKAFKALKKGDIDKFLVEAYDPQKGFVRQSGKVLRGLQRRREAEKNLFLYGDDYNVASLDNQFLNA